MTIDTLFCLGPIAFLILAIVMIRNSSKNATSADQSGHYKPVVKSHPNTTSSYLQSYQETETDTTEHLERDTSNNDDDDDYDYDDDDDDEEKEARPTFFDRFVDDISRPFYKSSKDDEEEDEE